MMPCLVIPRNRQHVLTNNHHEYVKMHINMKYTRDSGAIFFGVLSILYGPIEII